jgi:uncharacterized paraquat-inducible protein A
MQPSRLKPGQTRHITTEEALARQEGQLVCRDRGWLCEKKEAIRSHRQSLKCPRCGGLLERREHTENGKAS